MSKPVSPASRRAFLKTMTACSFTAGASGFAANLVGLNAFAAQTEGYNALVCIFLYGGMDNMDTTIPADEPSYAQWADIRAGLVDAYAGSRDRSALLPLANSDMGDGRSFGWAPEMAPLHELYTAGKAAIVGNVGPLIEPLDRDSYLNGSRAVPRRLFSHNDQQSTWMASRAEGASEGWGGRIGDVLAAAGANNNASFTAISPSGIVVFLSGEQVRPFAISTTGAARLNAQDSFRVLRQASDLAIPHATTLSPDMNSVFAEDLLTTMSDSITNNAELEMVLEGAPALTTPKPGVEKLYDQLEVVARIISRRSLLGAGRQIFFVSQGGFDTHSSQVTSLPGLQSVVANAMKYFYDLTEELGVASNVTSFTASDFGRTINQNSSGTDHGWGGEHYVVGGAVNGNRVHGFIPLIERLGEFDSGSGGGGQGVIPTLAVEQYAAALGGWMGLSSSELREILPNLQNFDESALSSLFL